MNKNILIAVLAVLLAGCAYFAFNRDKAPIPVLNQTPAISWEIEEVEDDAQGDPQSHVTLIFNSKNYDAGTYKGSCREITSENPGVDGKGLLPNEVSAVQCWFAGGGSEIGVFKYEDLYIVNIGILEEGDAENPLFRGTFEGLLDLP